jgi:hypothetical protein
MRVSLLAVGLGFLALAFGVALIRIPLASPTQGTAPTPATAAGATPRSERSPLPTVTPSPEDEVLASVWRQIDDPTLSYHLSGKGRSKIQGEIVFRFTLELDINGDDWAGKVNSVGGSGKVRMVRKDGVMYSRKGSARWQARRFSSPAIRMAPFMGVDSQADLVYDSPVVEDGRILHRLVSTSSYNPSIERMLHLATFRVVPDLVRLELYVTDSGVPIRATFRCEARGPRAAGSPEFVGTADYTFSEFGANFSIKAP